MASALENLWLPRAVTAVEGGRRSGPHAPRRLVVARAGGDRFALAFSSRERARSVVTALGMPVADLILCLPRNHSEVTRLLDEVECVGVLVDYDPKAREAASAIRISGTAVAPPSRHRQARGVPPGAPTTARNHRFRRAG